MSSAGDEYLRRYSPGNNDSYTGRFSHGSKLGLIGIGIAGLLGLLLARLMVLNPVVALIFVGALAVLAVATNLWRGAILLLLASQFNGFRFDYGAFTFRPDQLVLLVVAGIVLVYFVAGRFKLFRTVLDIPIVAFLLVGLLASALNSPDQAYSYQGLMLQVVYAGMYFMVVNILLNFRDKLDDTIKAFLLIAIAHSIYAIVAFVSFQVGVNIGGISSAHYGSLGLPSTSGFFQEANLFAAGIVLAVVLFSVHIVSYTDTKLFRNSLMAFGLIVTITVVATSMTRSVWVGLVIVLIILPFYSRPRRNIINPKALGIICAFAVTLGLVILPALNYAFSTTSGDENALYTRMSELVDFSSGSGAGRLDVQDIAFERWDEKPIIGHGILSLEGREGSYGRGWFYSSFVQSLFDTGLAGALLIILIHVIPIIYALYAARMTRSPLRRVTLVGLALGALVMAVASQASSFFWLGFPWIFLAILIAIAKSTIEDERGKMGNLTSWRSG